MTQCEDTSWVFNICSWRMAFGWYPGEPFKLLSITILEMLEGIDGKIEVIVLLDVQCLRFAISVGFHPG